MKKKMRRFWTFQNLLIVTGGILGCLGLALVILAVILSSISFRRFENIVRIATQLGPILALSGASTALFFSSWVVTSRTDLRTRFLAILFNQVTGVILLGGLLMGLVGYYWIGDEHIGQRGFALHILGWFLIVLKLSFIQRVMLDRSDD